MEVLTLVGHKNLTEEQILLCTEKARDKRVVKVEIRDCTISAANFEPIADLLETCSTITSLDLSDNELNDDCILRLLVAMTSSENCLLQEINLEDNEMVRARGVVHLGEILDHSESLIYLNLTGICVGLEIYEFCAGLSESTSLKTLMLDNAMMDCHAIAVLAETLHSDDCRCDLENLSLGYTHMTDAQATSCFFPFFQSSDNLKLKSLELECSVSVLMQGQAAGQHEAFLRNGCAQRFTAMIGKALARNSELQTLGLRCNGLCDADCERLAVGLQSNCRLIKLDLGQNNIGDIGAETLSRALRQNELSRLNEIALDLCLTERCLISNER